MIGWLFKNPIEEGIKEGVCKGMSNVGPKIIEKMNPALDFMRQLGRVETLKELKGMSDTDRLAALSEKNINAHVRRLEALREKIGPKRNNQ